MVNIDRESVRKILVGNLNIKKVCAKMVPKNLTIDQKFNRKEICSDTLKIIKDDPSFGIIFVEWVPSGQTVNQYYYKEVLIKLRERVRKKRPDLWKNGWVLHQDNAPAHSAFSIQRFLTEKKMSVLQHPPYSPDLAPCDFFLFPKIKSFLKGTHFQTVDDVKMKTAELLKGLNESDWQHCFQEWQRRMQQCIDAEGSLVILLSHLVVSWADFENQFKRTFVGEVSIGDRWKEMVRCVQQKSENVLEYFHEKMHLCSSLELSFSETKTQVIEGLYSKELSMHLLSRNHTDADELLNDIISFERLNASRALRIRQSTSAPKEPSPKTPALTRTTDTRQTATSNSIACGPVRIYFNCDSKSHIASSCSKPRIEKGACYQCGTTTHQRSKCPSLVRTTKRQEETSKDGATNDGESRVMNVNYERPESTQDHPGPYKVVCECNFPIDPDTLCGITFVAIIDTGSPISLLKRELLPNNSDVIKPLDNSCNFSGINGTKLELLGIFETEIFIHDDMFNLRFYIVPGNTMVMNAILGRDFVNKPNVNSIESKMVL
ncbi:hypothetical protein QTP88_024309 [Uroleucon formosanum]